MVDRVFAPYDIEYLERAVCSELVSGPKSLIDRENAGKLSRSRLPARSASPVGLRSTS